MDISKEYILMCEKAVEIQALWKPIDGDMLRIIPGLDKSLRAKHREENTMVVNSDKFTIHATHIWLPRQDQLQDMSPILGSMILTHSGENKMFTMEYWCYDKEYSFSFTSIEQCWLAFVMKEKYNKIWDGENWKEVI